MREERNLRSVAFGSEVALARFSRLIASTPDKASSIDTVRTTALILVSSSLSISVSALEILLCVVEGDVPDDLSEIIHVGRILTVLNPVSDHVAEYASEILVA